MRTRLRATGKTRVLPFVLLFVAVGVLTGLNVALVHARGLAFTVSLPGALLQLPSVLGLSAVSYALLTRLKGSAPRDAGLAASPGDARSFGLAWLAGVALVGLAAATLTLSSVAPLRPSSAPPSWATLAAGAVAFVVDATFQQLALQSFALAASPASPGGEPARPGARALPIALAALVFVLSHVAPSASPLYLANVFLFGALTSLLFFRHSRPSYAAPVGLHAGWNFAYVFVMGCPVGGAPSGLGLLEWPAEGALLSGGAGGFDAGLLDTLLLAALCVAAYSTGRAEAPTPTRPG